MGKIIKQLGSIERQLNKVEITNLANANAKEILNQGTFDILRVYIELKRYETYLKELIQQLKDQAYFQAVKMGEKSFSYDFAKISITARTKWDFSSDTEWTMLEREIHQLMEQKKERELYLKSDNKLRTVIDHETGEISERLDFPKQTDFGISITL